MARKTNLRQKAGLPGTAAARPVRSLDPEDWTSYRRQAHRALDAALDHVEGVKLQLAGRLGGSEMARCELASIGSVPLQALRAMIDYGFAEASTAYGNIGVKCWIYKGDYRPEGVK